MYLQNRNMFRIQLGEDFSIQTESFIGSQNL